MANCPRAVSGTELLSVCYQFIMIVTYIYVGIYSRDRCMAENVFFSLNVVPFTVTLQFSCRLFNKSTLIINYNLFNKYRQNACNNGTGGAERG